MKIRDLKQEIIKIIPSEYKVQTNFSCPDFMVEFGNLIICAKTICTENEVYYEFVLDIQFVFEKELTYQEIAMAKDVIELLNQNKKLATSRLKKWTVEEYLKDQKEREKRSKEMLDTLKKIMTQAHY